MMDYKNLEATLREQGCLLLNERKYYSYLNLLNKRNCSGAILLTQPDLVVIGKSFPEINSRKYRYVQFIKSDKLGKFLLLLDFVDRKSPVISLDNRFVKEIREMGFTILLPPKNKDVELPMEISTLSLKS